MSLQTELEEILGNRNVYFQPPSSIQLKYPCIVYSFENLNERHANDSAYLENDRYTLILMTKDPLPDVLITRLNAMPYTSFDRQYSSDNVHHFVFTRHVLERA